MAATLIFLQIKKLDGNLVFGESTAANYTDQIEIESFSWGVKADHSPVAGTDKVSTQVQYDSLEVTKHFDRSTTALCRMMESAGPPGRAKSTSASDEPQHFQYALLSFVDMVYGSLESSGIPVLEIKLSDGYISDIRLNASPSGKNSMQVKETVTLSYREVKCTYYVGGTDRSVRGKALSFEAESASVKK